MSILNRYPQFIHKPNLRFLMEPLLPLPTSLSPYLIVILLNGYLRLSKKSLVVAKKFQFKPIDFIGYKIVGNDFVS